MRNYALYFSPTGGTKKVLDVMETIISCEKEIDFSELNEDYTQFTFQKEEVCLFAVPSFGGRVPAIAAERISKMKGNGAKAVLIAVFGNRAIDDTLLELKDTLTSAGFECMAAVEAVAEHSIMHRFGASRPDADDKRDLQSFAKKILKKLQSDEQTELKVSGNYPYKEYKGIPLKPSADKKCTKCGKCAQRCPVGAIDKQNPDKTDTALCISCMRCIAECPNHARKLNPVILKAAAAGMKKACSERKENKLYL